MTQKHLLTKEGLEKFSKELENLVKVRRPEVIERIQEAVAHGDLSENADYAQAKEEQEMIESRVNQLEEILKNTDIITKDNKRGLVNVGSTVKVKIDGQVAEYSIVGSGEANPSAGKISNESLVGRQLIGLKVGEKAVIKTPAGEREYEVVELS
ncbi:MAG: transcription elongation factor GreA [Candidatus Doudnabacteria bacterium CG10_big_fil_rev_8_21_14_0_10_41_10]|uniref:Transcription elongation factor GreA n=1 Tax=Candidatus Doudnabacteria bacterium CG10_big_fil_rev_8_21_14_0_10_41_10 TaxID=1974551 RepID=A0A2H0VC65_9BACT|nr:MAG: transcription elongation factor GreA [Candidatus Doudnabacteria bacterium CG10_big_fil_rev_8_21_14_0_10_41_10]